jgi:hypothetical protein
MIFWRSPPCQEASKGQCAKIFLLLKGKGKGKEKEKKKKRKKKSKKKRKRSKKGSLPF